MRLAISLAVHESPLVAVDQLRNITRHIPEACVAVHVSSASPEIAECLVGEATDLIEARQLGFDHGVGHPLLLLCNAKAPNYRKNKASKDSGNYSEWPKVADAVIEAKSKA